MKVMEVIRRPKQTSLDLEDTLLPPITPHLSVREWLVKKQKEANNAIVSVLDEYKRWLTEEQIAAFKLKAASINQKIEKSKNRDQWKYSRIFHLVDALWDLSIKIENSMKVESVTKKRKPGDMRRKVKIAIAALEKILSFGDEVYDEWSHAEAYEKAEKVAQETLKQIKD